METIRGRIVHVLETWPLQLVVESAGRRHDVRLSDTTRITRSGGNADPGQLQPNMEIEISGETAGSTMVAQSIAIR